VISKAPGLQRLILVLPSKDVLDQFFKDLTIAIENNLHNLVQLDLNLSQIYGQSLTDQGLDYLSALIEKKGLQKLKTLCLDFSWSRQITDKSVVRLVSAIRDNVLELTELKLSFQKSKRLTEAIIHNTSLWNFRHFKSLEIFCPYFVSENISEESQKILTEHLSYIKHVKLEDYQILF